MPTCGGAEAGYAMRHMAGSLGFLRSSHRLPAVGILLIVATIIAALPAAREDDRCAHALDGITLPFALP